MGMAFVRFVVPGQRHEASQRPIGVVALAYRLRDAAATPPTLQAELRSRLAWLERELPVPDRFNRTSSKGWYRRDTRGLSWLRASASAHVDALRRIADAVRRAGHEVEELRATRVGYVTYEDALQVVAEPFRDTPTGATTVSG